MKIELKWIPVILMAFLVRGELLGQGQAADPASESPSNGWHRFGEPGQQGPPPPPPELTLPSGTWVTVRTDQLLSSDRNQQGDVFTATLAQPLVANGRVIARRGQTVAGVVASVEKAGRVKGTSRLRLELTEISLVDGRQVQVKSTLMERRGNTSVGRDATAIGTATGVGAMIGGAIDCGYGAGVGALAGAAASTIGVLVTRGNPTVVYPEDTLAFRTESPVTIEVMASGDVFQPVQQEDYEQPRLIQQGPPQGPPPRASYSGYYPPPVYGGYVSPYFYGGFYSPYYYGLGFGYYSRPYYGYRGYSGYHGAHGGHYRH
jgi:hypothetical protein